MFLIPLHEHRAGYRRVYRGRTCCFVIQWWPPAGAGALLVAYLVFPKYLKPTIERWLFQGELPRESQK